MNKDISFLNYEPISLKGTIFLLLKTGPKRICFLLNHLKLSDTHKYNYLTYFWSCFLQKLCSKSRFQLI